MSPVKTPDEIRERLSNDLANGKTVVLSTRELDDPSLREQLPQLLEDLSAQHPSSTGAGPQIPGYTMLGEIGQGGMSTVYLARQENLGRHVAVKIAPAWLGGGERARKMLVQEAQAMARLQHANIVVIHDIIDVDDTFAIAMEWIDGRTLASLLRTLPSEPSHDDMALLYAALGTPEEERERFEQTTVRHFVRQIRDIALAVQAVHDAELLHLDIKPSNVLIRRDGTPLLADFGVTREISPELTQTRTFAGTPVYAAPEQLRRDDRNIGPRTDVYGLGVTLYEALARTQPLQGLDLPGIVQTVESGSMPPLASKVAVPPDLANIVHRAIAPEPEHRYASAQEFADDLDAFLDHRPVQARPLTRTQRLRRWMRNEPWKAALAATLAVMLPALLILGTYLAVQMPAIFAAEVRDRQEQANHLKQKAFQLYLTDREDEDSIQLLERALELDPTMGSLVGYLALANERGWPHLDALIARERSKIDADPVLTALRIKAEDRRSFFTDEEIKQLQEVGTSLARYAIALDRFFHAADERSKSSLDESMRVLVAAAQRDMSDPLLYGLMAWTASLQRDMPQIELISRTLSGRWPDNMIARCWAVLATERLDAALAVERINEVLELFPKEPYPYEVLAANRMRQKDPEGVRATIERARTAGAASEFIGLYPLMTQARRGDADKARELIAHPLTHLVSSGTRLKALLAIDREQAIEAAQAMIQAQDSSPRTLKAVALSDIRQRKLSQDAINRFLELYKDRRALHPQAIMLAWPHPRRSEHAKREAMRKIAQLGREASLEGIRVDTVVHLVLRANLFLRDWDELQRHATEWITSTPDSEQTYYYGALGKARQGHYLEAGVMLSRAVAAPPKTETGRPPSYYVAALIEDAWLRASPESAPELRDPVLAMNRLRQFDAANPKLRESHFGPWIELTRAEVLWANGEHDAARTALAKAQRDRRPHMPVRRDFQDFIQRAAERMKKK